MDSTTERLSFLFTQNLNAELQLATESFLDGEGCVIDMDKKEVQGIFAVCSLSLLYVCWCTTGQSEHDTEMV